MQTGSDQLTSLTRRDLLDIAHLSYQAQLEDVIFRVVDSYRDLTQHVKEYRSDHHATKPLKIVYDVHQGRHNWATLVLYGHSKTVDYMNPQGEILPNELKQLFTGLVIAGNKNGRLCNSFDSGIIALHYAMKSKEIPNATVLKDLRKKYAEQVEIMKIQRKKLDTLSKTLSNFPNNLAKFTYESGNKLIYFLETVALQSEVTRTYKEELTNIIGREDVERVMLVRTKILLHRDASNPVIIEPQDLKTLINNAQLNEPSTVQAFFDNLKNYVHYLVDKFNYRDFSSSGRLMTPIQFLKDTAQDLGNVVDKSILVDKVETFLRDVLKEAFKDSRRKFEEEQNFIFYLIVNYTPYSNPKKCPKPLEKIQDLRNLQIHEFYKLSDDEYATKHAFINYLREHRNCLFKSFYARDVHRLVKDLDTNINKGKNKDVILQKLDESLEKIKKEIDDQNTVVAQPSIEQDFKLLAVIVNENITELRKQKRRSSLTTTRYDQLSIDDLMHIRTELMNLKQLKSENPHGYKTHLDTLERNWKTDYDISKNDFTLLIALVVVDGNIKGSKVITRIKTDLKALTTELNYSINNNFTVKSILTAYLGRRNQAHGYTKGSFEEKIAFLPEGYKAKVQLYRNYIVEIDTDKIVEKIFEMRSNEDRRRKVYNEVQDAFDDPEFLDYLEAQNIELTKLIGNNIITTLPDYMAPLLARIIVVKGIKQLQPLEHVLQKLRHKSIGHFLRVFDYVKNSKNKFSLVWKTFWDVISEPNFDFESIEDILEDSDRKVIKYIITECINYIGKAKNDQDETETRSIIWKLLQTFETVVVKKVFKDDHNGALTMLLDDNEIKEIAEATKYRASEVLWRLRLTEAKIKWKVWDLNKCRCSPEVYQQILDESIKIFTKFQLYSDEYCFDVHYFVALNYLGKAIDKRGCYDKTCNIYIEFHDAFVKYVLKEDHVPQGPWTTQVYQSILNSDRYKKITEDLQTNEYFDVDDYPDIFRLRKNIAYYKHCDGVHNKNIGQCKEALQIVEEVRGVLVTLSGGGVDRELLKTKKSLSKLYYDIGIALKERRHFQEALKYFKENVKVTTEVVDSQSNLFWSTHPGAIRYFKYAIYAFKDIADLHEYLKPQEKENIYAQFKKFINAHLASIREAAGEYMMTTINSIYSNLKVY